MSGWTIITVRGRVAQEYEKTRKDWENDRSYATEDIAATFDQDDRIRAWECVGYDHVSALLSCGRYDWKFAESLLQDYGGLVDDAVVLGWNDTTDTGCARYYPRADLANWTHQFEEEEPHKGERALAVMYAQYGINASNPFHGDSGRWSERHAENGAVQNDCLGE